MSFNSVFSDVGVRLEGHDTRSDGQRVFPMASEDWMIACFGSHGASGMLAIRRRLLAHRKADANRGRSVDGRHGEGLRRRSTLPEVSSQSSTERG